VKAIKKRLSIKTISYQYKKRIYFFATASFKAFLALKTGTFRAVILISAPVCGLRPFLARTLLRDSDIIILDESLNALDKESEIEIINNLNTYIKKYNKTLIIVTHKPSILSICNKLFVIKNGKIEKIENKFSYLDETSSLTGV
jgi:ABC-type taurine transport system ATPase subunit